MNKSFSRVRNFLAASAAVLMLAGCGTAAPKAPETPAAQPAKPSNPDVILATTTSTQDSGLLDVLVPDFEKKTGYKIKTIAVGTGQALTMGEKGEADVLLTHAPSSEKKLVDNKDVTNYQLVMHNDFVIVGPSADPAKIKGKKTAAEALKAIADSQSIFVSRGDDSGTHKMEKSLWKQAKIEPKGAWYQESGSGMGQTLNVASEKGGYTLTDRATYLATKKNLKLDILVEGEKSLLNIYHVMQVNPEKFSKVNKDGAKAFVDYLINPDTQKKIGDFGKDKYGQSLFFPDAGKKEEDIGK
ncbi:substrate-binding domain-containing protein [Effusibacillus lacus]|uniref:Tungsten ABC transporter substrate-binding protein n=1 Tax=Effusibacillus lacus TaxID=1348429 RepID=A0A292YQV1_9BACL|nr:substrate-binding domain-containing protein [Effusibacillus lacus]TCS76802.1 tungstate transport system substrate-binding protein [Effusibacillus lacus]GAX91133.1 tungsten ABC transporter substrate-binding protein [Effusibacillus lacus]